MGKLHEPESITHRFSRGGNKSGSSRSTVIPSVTMALAMPFRSIQHVYFDDLDALNILHNVRFLLFVERARGELFAALGFKWDDPVESNPDKYHVVAAHEIRYLLPVRGECDLCVEVRPTHIGSSSFMLAACIKSADGKKTFCDGSTRLVRLDEKTFRPCPWTDRFRTSVTPLLSQKA